MENIFKSICHANKKKLCECQCTLHMSEANPVCTVFADGKGGNGLII